MTFSWRGGMNFGLTYTQCNVYVSLSHGVAGSSDILGTPLAASAEDPRLGPEAVFRPVPSCLSDIILVVFVQDLGMLEKMDLYRDLYDPFVRDIEFYVDGTWCDPRAIRKPLWPCYGEALNRYEKRLP